MSSAGLVGIGLIFLVGGGVLLLIVVGVIVAIYNGLVSLRNQCENAWSQIDVQLKRRNDLIPNLIETVKGYATHEKTTFENVTKARAAMANAQTVKEKAQANNMLTDALKSLFAVVENYPQLKANENFMQLQEELTTTENKISYARQFYNDSVMRYDTKRQTFPSNLIANMFRFVDKDYFEVAEAEKAVPKVKF
ncbi:MAG: LemA family protein [Candidatus Altiarchaeota archaeon]|nr:LemA family protein [Candidatus Altiarchaeota archaeon]